MLFIMFNDFENFIVIKGNDKEEYAKDAVTGKRVHDDMFVVWWVGDPG